jgi:glycosyltransferase involved in cell wall biosynthesis
VTGVETGAIAIPTVTVLVVAHKRQDFLLGAVHSALEQTARRESFQVVVVKSFSNRGIDDELEALGVEHLYSPSLTIGSKIVEALPVCTGHVCCLLEDDDLFERTKVERVQNKFAADPELLYYHHSRSYIDTQNGPLKTTFRRSDRRRIRRLTEVKLKSGCRAEELAKLRGTDFDFNNSSIAVRKDLLSRGKAYLEGLASTDTALFFLAVTDSGNILVDGEELTRYRIHLGNTILRREEQAAPSLARVLEVGRSQIHPSYVTLERIASDRRSPTALSLARAYVVLHTLYYGLLDPESGRRDMAKTVAQAMRASTNNVVFASHRLTMLTAGLFVISPLLARKIALFVQYH